MDAANGRFREGAAMGEIKRYAFGAPFWVEIASPAPEVSRRFYGDLFGWYMYTLTIEARGDYSVFTLRDIDGPAAASMQTLADDTQAPSWSCYFRTDDLDATLDAIRAAGGEMLMEPVRIAQFGRAVLCVDTQGAEFALWQPLDSALVPIAGEPSTMRWVQLACRDAPEALRFYGEVFGWGSEDVAHAGSVYTNWKIGDRPVAGLVTMDERWPPDYPAHWIPYFQVLDCDASTERAVELGGRMRVPPGDAEMGRFSILTDPTGARFAVLAPTAEAREKFDTRAARGR
ncbi:VOC family protein [Actinomadura sp. BRA 177]|uniref:VOC family protein n=1 Tax=Actinomadura sp. BRA 177 TaxID=2745202 RepID=UPI0015958CBB|nr:VOC family protein [Actinomadura sp. BRA 177]NVI92241.1 VOC family protein [Actinomadura sp. BRA 177]